MMTLFSQQYIYEEWLSLHGLIVNNMKWNFSSNSSLGITVYMVC